MNRKVTMAGVESSEGRKGHEEKAIRMTLEFPYARQLGKGRAFFPPASAGFIYLFF